MALLANFADTIISMQNHMGIAAGFCFFFSMSVFAQSERTNLRRDIDRYKPYSLTEIKTISADIDFNPRGVAAEIGRRLNEFYLSDPSRKKIQNRQDLGDMGATGVYNKVWNINLTRLFIKDLLATQADSFLIKEAPNIFALHRTMAQAQQKMGKPLQAAFHYSQSLRYRTLRLNPDVYTNKDRLSLLENDDIQIAAADEYRRNNEELKNLEQQLETQKLQLAADIDNLERENYTRLNDVQSQKENNKAALQNQIEQNKKNLEALTKKKNDLQSIVNRNKQQFENIANEYNRESANLLVEIAELVYSIEDKIKERQKILNKKVLYKTEFNQALLHDYSQNRDFTAFANLMESAARLDPKNAQIAFRLGKEYKSSQNYRRAIYAYEKTIEAQEKENSKKISDAELASVYLSLGALYHQTRRYVDSVFFYEKAFENTAEEKEKLSLAFELGKLHAEHTGNYKKSISHFEYYLEYLKGTNPSEPESKVQWLRDLFHTQRYLAFSWQKLIYPEKMNLHLQEARNTFLELDDMIQKQRDEIQEVFNNIQVAKRNLLRETPRDDLDRYHQLEITHKYKKQLLGQMEATRNSVPIGKIYTAMALHYEKQNDLDAAIQTYQEAEKKGIIPDVARRALLRLAREKGKIN